MLSTSVFTQMGTHYIDYEPRSASTKRRGLLRIAAVASSILLTGGYVLYRVRAAPAPAAVPMTRVPTITTHGKGFITLPPARMATTITTTTRPTTVAVTLEEERRLLLISSSKSGMIIPPPQPTTQP